MKKQSIWVFQWRKFVHYWWSYILFSPECKELTSMLDPLLYRWGVPPVVIRCVHWTMQMWVLQTWIKALGLYIVMIHFVYVWCVIVFLVMVPKYVIDVAIIWLNDNIYSRNTWFPTTDVQTQNIGKPRYANSRAPTECRHTVATQATEYQRWRDVSCRSRRCRPMPTLGQRRNASWEVTPFDFYIMQILITKEACNYFK